MHTSSSIELNASVCAPSLDRYNVCHGVCMFVPIGLVYTYTCNLCVVKGGSTEKPVTWELHMHEENTVTFTQCVHVHKSVRVTARSCSHILL